MSCIYTQGGIFFDRRLRNDTGFTFGTKYTPLSDPQDETSAPQTAVFNRLTGNLWATVATSRAFPTDFGKMLLDFFPFVGWTQMPLLGVTEAMKSRDTIKQKYSDLIKDRKQIDVSLFMYS